MSDERNLISDDREGAENSNPELLGTTTVTVWERRFFVIPEVFIFLYFLALQTQSPLLQFWLYDQFSKKYNLEKGNDSDLCKNNSQANSSSADLEMQVQTETDNYIMYMNFIGNFVAIFPTIFLGPLTDKFGRKFVLYISFTGLLASQLLTLFIFQFDLMPELLFVGSFIGGLCGSIGLLLAATFGIVADITSAGKQRALRVTTMEGSIAIASSIAITLSGLWVNEIGYVWPIAVSVGELVLAQLIIFFMPETFIERHYHPFSYKTFIKSFEFYHKDTPSKRRLKLLICLTCFLIIIGAAMGEANFGILYLLHQPFCWSKTEITFFYGGITLLKWVIVLLFIVVGRRWISEPVFAILGSLSSVFGYLLRGLARSNLLFYIGAGTSMLSDLVLPMCRSLMSKAVLPSEQGSLFSGIGVLQMIVTAVSGIGMSSIYNVGLEIYLGLPYVVLAGFVSITVILLVVLNFYMKRHPQAESTSVIIENTDS